MSPLKRAVKRSESGFGTDDSELSRGGESVPRKCDAPGWVRALARTPDRKWV